MRYKVIRYFPGLFLCALTVSCIGVPKRKTLPVPYDLSGVQQSATAKNVASEQWWLLFNDANLNELVRTVLIENLDVRQAWSRLDQSLSRVTVANAARRPSADLTVSGARTKSSASSSFVTGKGSALYFENYTIGVAPSYEFDLWRKLRAGKSAATFQARASRADLEALAILLTSQTVENWLRLTAVRDQLRLLRQQVNVDKDFLEIVSARFRTGEVTAVDVLQQKQVLAADRAQIPLLESQEQVLTNVLAVLQGKVPQSIPVTTPPSLPDLPGIPVTGIPGNLLARRPDVRAAFAQLQAAGYDLDAAQADRFPALKISSSYKYNAGDLVRLFDDWAGNFAASLTQSLLDGGRRKATVRQNEAVVKASYAAYSKVILQAVQEVADALIRESKQREYVKQLNIQNKIATEELTAAREQYVNGAGAYLAVLTALKSLHNVERGVVTAEKDLLLFRVRTYKALGGTWPTQLARRTPMQLYENKTRSRTK